MLLVQPKLNKGDFTWEEEQNKAEVTIQTEEKIVEGESTEPTVYKRSRLKNPTLYAIIFVIITITIPSNVLVHQVLYISLITLHSCNRTVEAANHTKFTQLHFCFRYCLYWRCLSSMFFFSKNCNGYD